MMTMMIMIMAIVIVLLIMLIIKKYHIPLELIRISEFSIIIKSEIVH